MIKQFESVAKLILHWTDILLNEQTGQLDTNQRSAIERIEKAIQSIFRITPIIDQSLMAHVSGTTLDQNLLNQIHDIRVHINNIRGYASIFLGHLIGPLNPHQEHLFSNISQASQLALKWLDARFPSSRISNGPYDFFRDFDYFHLQDVLLNTQESVHRLEEGKPVEVIHQIEENLPQVFGDEFRVRKIILNLLTNSAEITDSGVIKVSAIAFDRNSTKSLIKLTVSTTVQTLSDEVIKELNNNPFRQQDIGLRVLISRGLMKLMGGRLWIEKHGKIGVSTHVLFCTLADQVRHRTGYSIPRRLLRTDRRRTR